MAVCPSYCMLVYRFDIFSALNAEQNFANIACKSQRAIPVAVRSKALVCGRSIAGIADLIPDEGVDFRLWCLLGVV